MEVVVLEIDADNRKLSLGHKQLEENPWDVFATVFTEGSTHDATIVAKQDKGFLINTAEYGVEAFIPKNHSVKEDGSIISVEEKLPFMIIEFNKEAKKIIASHTKTFKSEVEGEKKSGPKGNTKSAIKNLNSSQEKSTLGDLDALAKLKSEMEGK
jgi:small subunit ribosomal protein S1